MLDHDKSDRADAGYLIKLAYFVIKFIVMNKFLLVASLGTLLAGSNPLAATAQTLPSLTATGRYYVGLGGTLGTYQLSGRQSTSVLGPVLTGGRCLSPRFALEASLAYHWDGYDKSSGGVYVVSDGNGGARSGPAIFHSVYHQRTQVALALARYTLAYLPTRRFQLDVAGGVFLLHTNTYGYNHTLDKDTQEVIQGGYYVRYDLTSGGVLLGPSLRYRLSPQVELVGEFISNFTLGASPTSVGRLAGTAGLSARYYFGNQALAR